MVVGAAGAVDGDFVGRGRGQFGHLADRASGRTRADRASCRPSRGCSSRPATPTRPTCGSACAASRPTQPRPLRDAGDGRRCWAAACRRGSSPRCASGWVWPTTSSATTSPTTTPARCSRSPASTPSASTWPCRRSCASSERSSAEPVDPTSSCGGCKNYLKGRMVLQLEDPRGPAHLRAAPRGARGPAGRARGGARRRRGRDAPRTSSGWRAR